MYGILEGQFRNYFVKASSKSGVTGETLLQLLECRLDNVVYRLGLAPSRKSARQLVRHNHILINGKSVDIPSFQVAPGQEVAVREKSRNMGLILSTIERRGKQEVVNVEHEEVLLVPRWINCKRVTFKYGLGEQFIGVLKTLHMLGLDNKEPIQVKDVMVAPRDVVAACLPDPAHLGDRMFGQTCAGTQVKGKRGGQPCEVYIYQVADNEECMKTWGCQAVVAQTAFNAVIGWDLLEHSVWKATGVKGPEAFDAVPFMNKMAEYGFPYKIRES